MLDYVPATRPALLSDLCLCVFSIHYPTHDCAIVISMVRTGDQGIARPGGSMGQSSESAWRHRKFLFERDWVGARGDDRPIPGKRGAQGNHARHYHS